MARNGGSILRCDLQERLRRKFKMETAHASRTVTMWVHQGKVFLTGHGVESTVVNLHELVAQPTPEPPSPLPPQPQTRLHISHQVDQIIAHANRENALRLIAKGEEIRAPRRPG
jgi:hypothetical protein